MQLTVTSRAKFYKKNNQTQGSWVICYVAPSLFQQISGHLGFRAREARPRHRIRGSLVRGHPPFEGSQTNNDFRLRQDREQTSSGELVALSFKAITDGNLLWMSSC